FVRREVRLQVSPTFVKAGNNNEYDGGSQHQPGKKCEVLVVADFVCFTSAQNPFVNQTNEEFTGCDSEKPQRHHRALHRVRRLGIGKFEPVIETIASPRVSMM